MIIIFIMSSMNTDESNGKSKQTIKKTVQKTSEISEIKYGTINYEEDGETIKSIMTK